jgi:hypothetical protein
MGYPVFNLYGLTEQDDRVQSNRQRVNLRSPDVQRSALKYFHPDYACRRLPFKMQDDLRHILNQSFATQASRTSVKSKSGFDFAPEGVSEETRGRLHFPLHYETRVSAVGELLSGLVTSIH